MGFIKSIPLKWCQAGLAYLTLVQPQYSYKISKAYRLGFCIFELHILINILCLHITAAILQVVL